MRSLVLAVVASAMLAVPARADTIKPLVDADWLKANLGKPGIVVLSARTVPRKIYEQAHVPGAVYTSYGKDRWRVMNRAGVPSMLPPVAYLEKLFGSLGIGNSSHVVVVPSGNSSSDVGIATRIYWTFKVLGHDRISILNGGWRSWARIDKQTRKPVNPIAAGVVKPKPQVFKASLRKQMLVSEDEIKQALTGKAQLVDNRTRDYFVGISKSSKALRAGTLPGAKNLPQTWLTKNGRGKFRDKAQLEKIYKAVDVATKGDQIMFCNTGHQATIAWFVSSEILGNRKARMYDGSLAAWTRVKNAPVLRMIK